MSRAVLINPSHRPSRRKTRKAPSAAQRRARAAFAAMARARAGGAKRRRRNPIARAAAPKRRRNPIYAHARRHTSVRRRRRNPIGVKFSTVSIIAQLKQALYGGAGAVAMDVVMGKLNQYLPTMLQSNANTIGVGDAVKAAATIALGQLLRKPTKGLSLRLAQGALTVQAADIMRSFVPSTMTVGYATPLRVINNSPLRTGPNMRNIANGFGRYMAPGATQLLSAPPVPSARISRYMAPGASQLLSASPARNTNTRFR